MSIKQETAKKEALEALESILPGITKHLEEHVECCGTKANVDLIIGLFKETQKLQTDYPLLFVLALDAFSAVRDHEYKLEMLKDILVSIGAIETPEMRPPDDGYLN